MPNQTEPLPATGQPRPELARLDEWITAYLAEHKIPGASLAIAREGQLVYARGFGLADREAKTPVEPDNLFRIASVSKPITGVAIMKLVQDEKLHLEDKVLDYIQSEPHLEDGGKFDERWKQITVVECLSHTGGWDRDKSYDPMFEAIRMAKSLKIDLPILPEHIIRYQLGQPLDFDPLTRYAYSNFGYSILGRVIEKVSGQPYEKYVQENIFKPLGIERPRIGGSLASQRAEGEVQYYDVHDATGLAVVGPGAGKDQVPISYGTWRQETLDATRRLDRIGTRSCEVRCCLRPDRRRPQDARRSAQGSDGPPDVLASSGDQSARRGRPVDRLVWPRLDAQKRGQSARRSPRRRAGLHGRVADALSRRHKPGNPDEPRPIAGRQVFRPLTRRAADKARPRNENLAGTAVTT